MALYRRKDRETQEATDNAQSQAFEGRKNYLINGGFDFFQRGLSVGSTATKEYIAPDRFIASRQGSWWVSPVFSRFDGDAPSSKTRYVLRTYNSEAADAEL